MALSKQASITLGTAALLLVIAALVTVVAYQQTSIQMEGVSESVSTGATAEGMADVSGDVQIVSVQTMFSGKDKLIFVHECQGEVRAGAIDNQPTRYCVGTNFLSMKDAGAAEVALISESVSTSAEDAPLLASVEWVSGRAVGKTVGHVGTILIGYDVLPCSLSEETCGVGSPTNFVTYAVNATTKEVRPIKNYPESGTPIWNDAGTKAIFPVTQRGGAGCDDGPILGYDLTADATKVLTVESGCEFDGGFADDIEGNPSPVWGPTFWTSNDTFTSVLLGTDGKWTQIDGTF